MTRLIQPTGVRRRRDDLTLGGIEEDYLLTLAARTRSAETVEAFHAAQVICAAVAATGGPRHQQVSEARAILGALGVLDSLRPVAAA